MNPCGRSNGRDDEGTQRKPEADLKEQSRRKESAPEFSFEEVEDGVLLVDKYFKDKQ